MQMTEGAVGKLAHGILGDGGEPDIAELCEHHHHHPADAIGDDEEGGARGEAHRRDFLTRRLAGQEVDDRLVGDRHQKRDRLGDDQRDESHHHAHAEIGTAGGPDIGGKLAQDGEVPGPRLHQRVAPRLRQILHENRWSLAPARQKGAASKRYPLAHQAYSTGLTLPQAGDPERRPPRVKLIAIGHVEFLLRIDPMRVADLAAVIAHDGAITPAAAVIGFGDVPQSVAAAHGIFSW